MIAALNDIRGIIHYYWIRSLRICRTSARPLAIFACLLSFSSPAHGATIPAANCQQSSVQTAVNQAANGDTVTVPAGSCTWSTSVTVPSTKRLILTGAGAGSTILTFASGVQLSLGSSNSSVSGFTFQGSAGSTSYIAVSGNAGTGRIHHNTFSDSSGNVARGCVNLSGSGSAHPVYLVDHNTMTNCRVRMQGTSSGNGKPFWQTPASLPNFTQCSYVEDNVLTYNQVAAANVAETDYGGCLVIRFNTISGAGIDQHGTGAGTDGSGHGPGGAAFSIDEHPPGRVLEVYGNNCLSPNGLACVWIRAGTGFVFNNSIASTYTRPINFDIQGRTPITGCNNDDPPEDSACCNGSIGSDGNQGSGTSYPAAGWPCLGQPGFGAFINDYTVGTYPGMISMPVALFNNRTCASPPCSLSATKTNPTFQNSSQNWIANGHEYQDEVPAASFNGTIGTGVGPISSRPGSCTRGVYYWATDEGEWNSLNPGVDGRLYKCTATNTWTLFYTPYPYPHPLSGGNVPSTPQNFKVVRE